MLFLWKIMKLSINRLNWITNTGCEYHKADEIIEYFSLGKGTACFDYTFYCLFDNIHIISLLTIRYMTPISWGLYIDK